MLVDTRLGESHYDIASSEIENLKMLSKRAKNDSGPTATTTTTTANIIPHLPFFQNALRLNYLLELKEAEQERGKGDMAMFCL